MKIDKAFSALAGYGAGWVFWVLVALSVIAVAVAVDRVVNLVATRDDVSRLKDDVLDALASGHVAKAMARLRASPSYEAKVALAGLSSKGAEAAEERMTSASQTSKLKMEKNLTVLATIGANAPFVGLLGTVLGILNAFKMIAETGSGGMGTIGAAIGEALVVTGYGLTIAIPSVLVFNFLSGKIAHYETGLLNAGNELVDQLESGIFEPIEESSDEAPVAARTGVLEPA